MFCPPYFFWVLSVFKVDKRKSSWATRLLVVDNVDLTQWAIFRENVPQVSLSGVKAQTKHTQAGVWVWVGPVSNMSASIWHRGTTMAPTPAVVWATRSAPGTTPTGAGTRTGVVPAWAPVGPRSGFGPGSRPRSGPGTAGAIFGACWWAAGGFGRASRGCTPRATPRVLVGLDTEVRNTLSPSVSNNTNTGPGGDSAHSLYALSEGVHHIMAFSRFVAKCSEIWLNKIIYSKRNLK